LRNFFSHGLSVGVINHSNNEVHEHDVADYHNGKPDNPCKLLQRSRFVIFKCIVTSGSTKSHHHVTEETGSIIVWIRFWKENLDEAAKGGESHHEESKEGTQIWKHVLEHWDEETESLENAQEKVQLNKELKDNDDFYYLHKVALHFNYLKNTEAALDKNKTE
jgi:hypothetical protein